MALTPLAHNIVPHGIVRVTDLQPPQLRDLLGVPASFAYPMLDTLSEGPHHPDLGIQDLMRAAYFRAPRTDSSTAQTFLERLQAGEHLVYWGTGTLSSCLAFLWLLDWLHLRSASLDRVWVITDCEPWPRPVATIPYRDLFEHRVPAVEVAGPLINLRRRIASPDWNLEIDPDAIPVNVRPWLARLQHLRDFIPDDRGLDVFEALLLETLTEEWQPAVYPVSHALRNAPSAHSTPDHLLLWERLIQMSNLCGVFRGWQQNPDGADLCEMRLEGAAAMGSAVVRITPRGKGVRSGRTDALKHRNLFRWIGGRLLAGGHFAPTCHVDPSFDRRATSRPHEPKRKRLPRSV